MATVYILYSHSLDIHYIGSCKGFEKRLKEHLNNSDSSSYTYRADDWRLVFKIDNMGYQQSRKIEKHIKDMKSSVYIKNLAKYPEMVIKLIERFK